MSRRGGGGAGGGGPAGGGPGGGAPLAVGGAALGRALVPLAALVVEWNGLVPPSGAPASCGLCTDRPGVGRDALTLRTVGFTVALLGMYAALVLGPSLWRRVRVLRTPVARAAGMVLEAVGIRPRIPSALVGGAAAVGVALLLVSPLEYM